MLATIESFRHGLFSANETPYNLFTIAMEQYVSYIFIYYRGRLYKMLQFFMPLESIYKKNFCFDEQKCFLWTLK